MNLILKSMCAPRTFLAGRGTLQLLLLLVWREELSSGYDSYCCAVRTELDPGGHGPSTSAALGSMEAHQRVPKQQVQRRGWGWVSEYDADAKDSCPEPATGDERPAPAASVYHGRNSNGQLASTSWIDALRALGGGASVVATVVDGTRLWLSDHEHKTARCTAGRGAAGAGTVAAGRGEGQQGATAAADSWIELLPGELQAQGASWWPKQPPRELQRELRGAIRRWLCDDSAAPDADGDTAGTAYIGELRSPLHPANAHRGARAYGLFAARGIERAVVIGYYGGVLVSQTPNPWSSAPGLQLSFAVLVRGTACVGVEQARG